MSLLNCGSGNRKRRVHLFRVFFVVVLAVVVVSFHSVLDGRILHVEVVIVMVMVHDRRRRRLHNFLVHRRKLRLLKTLRKGEIRKQFKKKAKRTLIFRGLRVQFRRELRDFFRNGKGKFWRKLKMKKKL